MQGQQDRQASINHCILPLLRSLGRILHQKAPRQSELTIIMQSRERFTTVGLKPTADGVINKPVGIKGLGCYHHQDDHHDRS